MGDEAGIEGVLLNKLLKDLLGDLVVFEVIVDFELELGLGLGPALVGREVEPIITGGFLNQ